VDARSLGRPAENFWDLGLTHDDHEITVATSLLKRGTKVRYRLFTLSQP
jgi:hypothetical protein